MLVLFAGANRYIADRVSAGQQERVGVEYLRALQPVTEALVAAESAAVAGRPSGAASLTPVLVSMTAVDERLGPQLGTRARWDGLRTKISALPASGPPQALYDTYVETTNLLLALYDVVRQNSLLATDPSTDSYNLQNAVGAHLPALTISIGRYADLAVLGQGRDTQATVLAEVFAQRRDTVAAGGVVIDSVQTALAGTTSSTLSETLFSELDGVRVSLESLGTNTGLTDGKITTADVATTVRIQGEVARTSSALSTRTLDALDRLLVDRLDQVLQERTIAQGAFGLGILLAIVPVVTGLIAFLRVRRHVRAQRSLDEELPEPPGDPNMAQFPVWSSTPPAPDLGGRERSLAAR